MMVSTKFRFFVVESALFRVQDTAKCVIINVDYVVLSFTRIDRGQTIDLCSREVDAAGQI